ncbi:hypothetical protein BKA69DRAFT_631767 [Paraphysoderma sedebokerense]|nr:hypothetical protein BKA69DRAFT_631767 [Paraphysoderma sedebokerense]
MAQSINLSVIYIFILLVGLSNQSLIPESNEFQSTGKFTRSRRLRTRNGNNIWTNHREMERKGYTFAGYRGVCSNEVENIEFLGLNANALDENSKLRQKLLVLTDSAWRAAEKASAVCFIAQEAIFAKLNQPSPFPSTLKPLNPFVCMYYHPTKSLKNIPKVFMHAVPDEVPDVTKDAMMDYFKHNDPKYAVKFTSVKPVNNVAVSDLRSFWSPQLALPMEAFCQPSSLEMEGRLDELREAEAGYKKIVSGENDIWGDVEFSGFYKQIFENKNE